MGEGSVRTLTYRLHGNETDEESRRARDGHSAIEKVSPGGGVDSQGTARRQLRGIVRDVVRVEKGPVRPGMRWPAIELAVVIVPLAALGRKWTKVQRV